MLGPDLHGRRLTIVSATYDPVADRTTAVLRPVLADRFRELVSELVPEQQARERVMGLFRGQ
jgi:hypothetical protein